MSITMKELLGPNLISEVPLTHQTNLEDLQKRVNLMRESWGKPMVVTSGYRSQQKHLDVYRTKALREKRSFSMRDVPMGSAHLSGQAVDIADPVGALYKYLEENIELLEKAGLYVEKNTKGWVHLQTRAPRSGNRFFLP